MNTIFSTHKVDPGNKQTSSEEIKEVIHPYNPELNIADGGEFLDDGIRMEDQPYSGTTTEEDE